MYGGKPTSFAFMWTEFFLKSAATERPLPGRSAALRLQMAVIHLQWERWGGGIGFIGYYLEGQQELHAGHSSSPATWSEAGDSWWGREETPGRGGEGFGCRSTRSAHSQSTLSPYSLPPLVSSRCCSQPSEDRARVRGGCSSSGRGRKISCCYGNRRQRRSRAVCWAGV